MMPFFSVLIPVYNKEKHIESTIKSVLAQSFKNFEIIIINDGSTDSSGSLATSFCDANIRYFEQKHQGVSTARNLAISKARGTYMALLDADDLWHPTYLQTIYQLIQSYPEQHVFATAVCIETASHAMNSVYAIKNIKGDAVYVVDYFKSSTINTLLTSSSTVVHHSVFDTIGIYDTALKSGEDTDLWIRIGIAYKVVFINKALVTYRYQKDSLSNSLKGMAHTPTFERYAQLEKNHPNLKKFLDLNRFSLAITAKLVNDHEGFKKYADVLNYSNLNKKQRFLLKQPTITLKFLLLFKNLMQRTNIHLSAFK